VIAIAFWILSAFPTIVPSAIFMSRIIALTNLQAEQHVTINAGRAPCGTRRPRPRWACVSRGSVIARQSGSARRCAKLRGIFYLIGVNHNAQRFPPGSNLDGDQTKLERCLSKVIEDFHPKLIAVEENEDTLVDKRTGVVDESIPRNVAQRFGIEPMLLEPSDHDKTRLGYKCNSDIHAQLFTSDLLRDCPPSLQTAAVDAVEIAHVFPSRELF